MKQKTKTHVTTPSNKTSSSTTATTKQADILLRQIRTENAIKDLAKSNRQKGIIIPKSLTVSTSEKATTTPTQTIKSKKK